MNDILLYLTLKHFGDWMAVYNSLQTRERVSFDDIKSLKDKISCTYTTLLDDEYPEGFKAVYKPPFNIFSFGSIDLINSKKLVTVLADPQDKSIKPFLDTIHENNGVIVWPDLSKNDLTSVLEMSKSGNLFWFPQLKNSSQTDLKPFLEEPVIVNNNLFYSEIWERDPNKDYSSQSDERLYLGVSHKVLVLKELSAKEKLSLASYASMEDIQIIFPKELFKDDLRKTFSKCKVTTINTKEEIVDFFFGDNN